MHRRIFAALFAGALLALPACSHTHQTRVADVATQVSDPSFEGSWKSNAGRTAVIKHASRTGYTVTITDNSQTTNYDVDLLDIGGKRFVEIAVHDPDKKGEVPVYMYGRVDIKGNDLTYRRMRNEWLEKTAKSMQGVTYKSTGEVQRNTGGVVLKDAKQMQELLEKAAADPTAFGEPEIAHRVK
jgi:hypothetical protein